MAYKYDTVYDFKKPIHLIGYKRSYMQHFIYYLFLFALVLAVALLLFFRDGKLTFTITLGRVLITFPLVIIGYFVVDVVKENDKYAKKLLAKTHWSLAELMEMTGQDAVQTQKIITRVLEMSFAVDRSCIIKQPGQIKK